MINLMLSGVGAGLAWLLVALLGIAWVRLRLALSAAKGEAGAATGTAATEVASARVEEGRQRARADRAEHDGKALRAQLVALEERARREHAAGDDARAEATRLRAELVKTATPGAVLEGLREKLGGERKP